MLELYPGHNSLPPKPFQTLDSLGVLELMGRIIYHEVPGRQNIFMNFILTALLIQEKRQKQNNKADPMKE
jgi:hypothetical protein